MRLIDWIENLWCDKLDLCESVINEVEEVCNENACNVLKVDIDDWDVLRDVLDTRELAKNVTKLTNLRACFKRTCSWNLLFELKIFSQCLQIALKQLFFCVCCNSRDMNENFAKHCEQVWYCDEECKVDFENSIEIVWEDEKIVASACLKTFNEVKSSWVFNHLYVESRKHLTRIVNILCSLYLATSRSCKKLTLMLKRWNSRRFNCIIESKNSISLTQVSSLNASIAFAWTLTTCSTISFEIIDVIETKTCFWVFNVERHQDDSRRCFAIDSFLRLHASCKTKSQVEHSISSSYMSLREKLKSTIVSCCDVKTLWDQTLNVVKHSS